MKRNYVKISAEDKKRIEKNYRNFYNICKKNNKIIEYEDLEHFLPKSLVKREWEAIQQGGSYYLNLLIPVTNRANGRCELTGIETNNLQIHHLESYEFNNTGRLNPDNVVALAPEVHKRFHKEYGYKRCNRKQFEIFKRDVENGKIKIYQEIGD